jgi:hypothetical protein
MMTWRMLTMELLKMASRCLTGTSQTFRYDLCLNINVVGH